MADTAYERSLDAKHRTPKGALAVIPQQPSRALKYRSTSISMPSPYRGGCFSKIKQFRRVELVSKRPDPESRAVVTLAASSYGCE